VHVETSKFYLAISASFGMMGLLDGGTSSIGEDKRLAFVGVVFSISKEISPNEPQHELRILL